MLILEGLVTYMNNYMCLATVWTSTAECAVIRLSEGRKVVVRVMASLLYSLGVEQNVIMIILHKVKPVQIAPSWKDG